MINLIAKNDKYAMQDKITKIKNLIFKFKIELTKELKLQLLGYLKNNTLLYIVDTIFQRRYNVYKDN